MSSDDSRAVPVDKPPIPEDPEMTALPAPTQEPSSAHAEAAPSWGGAAPPSAPDYGAAESSGTPAPGVAQSWYAQSRSHLPRLPHLPHLPNLPQGLGLTVAGLALVGGGASLVQDAIQHDGGVVRSGVEAVQDEAGALGHATDGIVGPSGRAVASGARLIATNAAEVEGIAGTVAAAIGGVLLAYRLGQSAGNAGVRTRAAGASAGGPPRPGGNQFSMAASTGSRPLPTDLPNTWSGVHKGASVVDGPSMVDGSAALGQQGGAAGRPSSGPGKTSSQQGAAADGPSRPASAASDTFGDVGADGRASYEKGELHIRYSSTTTRTTELTVDGNVGDLATNRDLGGLGGLGRFGDLGGLGGFGGR